MHHTNDLSFFTWKTNFIPLRENLNWISEAQCTIQIIWGMWQIIHAIQSRWWINLFVTIWINAVMSFECLNQCSPSIY